MKVTPKNNLKIVRAACPHDCPDTCAMLVTVEDGRAVRVAGDPAHPVTRGTLCTKVANYEQRTHSADRVQTPLRRTGAKGEGRFARIGWDEALDEIASRFRTPEDDAAYTCHRSRDPFGPSRWRLGLPPAEGECQPPTNNRQLTTAN